MFTLKLLIFADFILIFTECTKNRDFSRKCLLFMSLVNNNRYIFPIIQVGNATSQYTLQVSGFLDGYSSTSGLLYNNGHKFYARDQDNGYGCAILRRCGFWFDYCTMANINGVYGISSGAYGMRDDTGGVIKYLNYAALKIQQLHQCPKCRHYNIL